MRFLKRIILPGLALAIGLGMGYTLKAQTATKDEAERPSLRVMLDLFQVTMEHVTEYYVEPVDASQLVESALKGMLSSLDPYSEFLTPKDLEVLDEETSGEYGGVGMQIGLRDGWPTVIAPFEGSPAYKKGLRPGDKVVEIEGESTYDMSNNEVVKRLRGPQGTDVTIKVAKPGASDVVEITLTRDIIKIHPVPYYDLVDGVGYIKMTSFSEDAASELSTAIDSLKARGAKGFILDLRGNPGGLLREATDVSDVLLPKNSLIVSTKGRGSADVLNYFAKANARIPDDAPLVVLVDNGSASASEIVAGALQDWDRALIVGDTTFGKGLVQRVFPLSYDYALRITTSRYYTPSGRCINKITRLGGEETRDTSADLIYHTKRLEREVKGGGGIVPDVVMETEKFHDVTTKAMAEGAVFGFAMEYSTKHKTPPSSGVVKLTDADMADFKKFLESKKLEFTDCEWEQAYSQLKYWLEQDIAEKYWGLSGRYRQSLKGDPAFEDALARVKNAKGIDDLLLGVNAGK